MLKSSRASRSTGRAAGGGPGAAMLRFLLKLAAGLLVIGALYAAYLDAVVTKRFASHRWTVPARVYARPLDLFAGRPITPVDLLAELGELGYRPVADPQQQGEYAVSADGHTFRLVTRGFRFPEGRTVPQKAQVSLSAGRIEQLRASGPVVRLEPVEIGALRPAESEDRILMRLAERPPYLVEALLSVEDRDFFHHAGVSLRGMVRALYVNLAAGEVQQGGSTLTQQLVKNFWLDSERTLDRKLVEAVMSVLLEVHYDKNTILETYCNEIYLGQSGKRAVHGFGLGSQFYFGRPVSELRLHEVALLVGEVKGPSEYNPWRHPDRALDRRAQVLDAMVANRAITAGQAAAAKAEPLGVVDNPRVRLNRYPAFLDLVRRELRDDLDGSVLARDGLDVFTTLDPGVQHAAEAALVAALGAIESDNKLAGVEGALVMANPATGEVDAAVGGRDVDYAGFNRVADARRTIGSLMKPVVYLAALSKPEQYSLATFVSDDPVTAIVKGSPPWHPGNYDHVSHGEPPDHRVMLIDALAHSWNLATARLGLDLGVGTVIRQAQALGVTAELPPYPSVLLGSATLSPVEVLAMYQPIANGGRRVPTHTLRGVLDAQGNVLFRPRVAPTLVIQPATAFLLRSAMEATLREGTATYAYKVLPPELVAAGKTGTTDDARDSWFAGFTGNYLAVAWVGYDDNRATPLSGATGALRVWTDAMSRLPQVSLPDAAPPGVEWAWLTPGGLERSAGGCAGARYLPVAAGHVPSAETVCGTATRATEGVMDFFRRLMN